MKRYTFATIILLFAASIASASWPIFMGNDARTGFTDDVTTAGLVESWQLDLESPIYISPVTSNSMVHVATADGRLVGILKDTGQLVWETQLPGWLEQAPTRYYNFLYFGCTDHLVYCAGASDGYVPYTFETGSWVESSPLVYQDEVYVGSSDHKFYKLTYNGLELQFALEMAYDVITAPSVAGDYICFGGDDEKIHAVDASGTEIWRANAGGAVYGAPMYTDGKVIYASVANGQGTTFNRIGALDAVSGIQIWMNQYDQYNFFYGSPAAAYGNVYIGDYQGWIRALNEADGSLVWEIRLNDYAILSSGVISNGVLYLGSNDGTLYAIDAFTGVILDTYETGGFMQAAPAIDENVLYAASSDGILYAFDLNSAVSVSVTPQITSVPAGGTLTFDVTLEELEGQSQNFTGWMKLTRPNGAQRDYGNPVPLNLNPGQVRVLNVGLNVPGTAPLGDYFLSINIGPTQDELWDAESFPFSVIPSEGDNSVTDWQIDWNAADQPVIASGPALPTEFSLAPPYPDPFNPTTTITYTLPNPSDVSLRVYDISGKLAVTLVNGYQSAGVYQMRWDAADFSSGMYIVKLDAGNRSMVQRVVLEK